MTRSSRYAEVNSFLRGLELRRQLSDDGVMNTRMYANELNAFEKFCPDYAMYDENERFNQVLTWLLEKRIEWRRVHEPSSQSPGFERWVEAQKIMMSLSSNG